MKTKTMNNTRQGFTLVEMLVAVGLVVLMMTMFATVFQTAGNLVTNQKGMAELDQDVRTMEILLRGDISQRTFVDVVPFVRDQDTTLGTVPGFNKTREKGYEAEYRKGFFSISENVTTDSTDDVLHLTIRMDSPLSNQNRLPFSGRSRLLRTSNMPANADAYLSANPDQPEFYDGQTTVNNTASSRVAEVCWFLRNGKLYRRSFLIRDPYNRGTPPNTGIEPQDSAGNEFIDSNYDPDADPMTPNYFWRDFDFSAYWEPDDDPMTNPPIAPGLIFHTNPGSLQNQSTDATSVNLNGLPRSLGNPLLRFGSSVGRYDGTNDFILGPREFILDGMNRRFIGRFTMQETCDGDFFYPGDFTFATDPHGLSDFTDEASDPSGVNLELNPANGLVIPYDNNNMFRRGEDLVLSNVHEFDIQVWDEGLVPPRYVNLGHGIAGGHYANPAPVANPSAPPATVPHPFGNRYDTWHPSNFMPHDPPYAPFNGNRSMLPANGLGDDGEVWLRGIQIKIRFFDVGSDQMRDLTFTYRLNRENAGDPN